MRNDAAGAQAARLLRLGPAAPGALAKRLPNDLKNDLANSSERQETMRLSELQTQRVPEQTGDIVVPEDNTSMPALQQTGTEVDRERVGDYGLITGGAVKTK